LLSNHAADIAAMGLFVVPTPTRSARHERPAHHVWEHGVCFVHRCCPFV